MPRFIFCLPTDRVSGLFNKLFFYSRIGRFWPEFLVISSQELRIRHFHKTVDDYVYRNSIKWLK